MGIFSRIKKGAKARANAAIDKMVDPEKELDLAIAELEEQRKDALRELLSYKTTAKQMEQDITRYRESAEQWEKKAMAAVKAGDDELAKHALKEKKLALIEVTKIKRDRDEAAGYAIELNNSRKKAETKLKILKLKKGTLATQLKVARSGNTNAFGHDDDVWERFERAEEMIDNDAIEAEVDAALKGEDADGGPLGSSIEIERKLLGAEAAAPDADDALAALKEKMVSDRATKKLTE